MSNRKFLAALAIGVSLLAGAFVVPAVNAQVTSGLNAVGNSIALSATDPRIIAARIINVALGFLGIVFLGIILYAGFLWMTAGGDPAKVTKAKGWIRNGVIGLIIILSSWAIAYYVINVLLNATGGGGGGLGGGGGGAGGGGLGGGNLSGFVITKAVPVGTFKIANLTIGLDFNQDVNFADLSKITITPPVAGSWVANGTRSFTFQPSQECPGAPTKKCFAFDTAYTVEVPSAFKSANNITIQCGGFNPACKFTFTAGHEVDAQAPSVDITSLYDGKNVGVNSAVEVSATAHDDNGVAALNWFQDGNQFDNQGPTADPTPTNFSGTAIWDTTGLVLKQTYSIKVQGHDVDSNVGEKSVNVVVVAQHCVNSVKDADETGLNCGGVDCNACAGGSCTKNTDCGSGMCLNGVCVEQPIITNVSPVSGKAGTFVSIWGGNFGKSGTVTFLGPPTVVAQAPAACVASGGQTWTDGYVLVELPEGAQSGPVRIDNAESKLYDQTDDDRGPKFSFKLTNEEKPGLCLVDPNSGKPGKSINLYGNNFGDTKGAVIFGQNYPALFSAWGSATVTGALVPVLSPGTYSVSVKHANGSSSNPLPFEVQSPQLAQPAPLISTITPSQGPKGQYISLLGQRFGNEPNVVVFYDKAGDKEYSGDSLFPNECAGGWWKDGAVVIKVPAVDSAVIKPAQFSVWVRRKDGAVSNKVDFTYTEGTPGPGVCSVKPNVGPVGTDVTLSGEFLGSAGQGNNVVFALKNNSIVTKDWNAAHVTARVPVGSVTGGVYMNLGNASSNQVQYTVANCNDKPGICTGNEICCGNGTCSTECKQKSFTAMYSWQLSTGAVPTAPVVKHFCDTQGLTQPPQGPSPSPSLEWPGGDQVCNSPKPKITILFDPVIRWPSQTDVFDAKKLFKLIRCDGKGADPCEKSEDRKEIPIANLSMSVVGTVPNQMSYVMFEPADNMVPGTVYYVYVMKEVHGADMVYGDIMKERTDCPEVGLGECFKFRTRTDTEACEISKFILNPWLSEVEGGAEVGYTALPVPKESICTVTTCGGLSVDWSTGGANANKAQIAYPNQHTCENLVKAGGQEAVTPPIDVLASLTGNPSINGLGKMTIKFVAPKLLDKFPNCTSACSNIWMWLQFNTAIKQESLNDKTVKLYRCENENCLPEKQDLAHLLPLTVQTQTSILPQYQSASYDQTFWRLDLKAPNKFTAGTYYLMRVEGGKPGLSVLSSYGVLMPQPVEWKFRIRPTNDVCKPDSISLVPTRSIKQTIGQRELFSAEVMGPADECNSLGQTLTSEEAFSWSVDDAQVAKLVTDPGIDADGVLPDGCTTNCKAQGAQGVYGAVAVCGNGTVETTDDKYCVNGSTLAGQKCTIMAMASGAGEQCDSGALCDENTCLWKPSSVVDDVAKVGCGNFKIENALGEMCDPGLRCWVSATSTYAMGTPCDSPAAVTACQAAGGKCGVGDWQGCSAGCKNLGSSSVPDTTCGNGDIAAGEDCDQGTNNGLGGCSGNCLHKGLSKKVIAVCGNGILEPGETCEAPLDMNQKPTLVPSWCDNLTCLRKGLTACAKPTDIQCCGNNTKELGEDCDDGNLKDGDGCSQICLSEGSSWLHATPSFCGDGKVGTGEMCEVGKSSNQNPQEGSITGAGNGKLDGLVLAQIVGNGTPDADGIISTKINATYSGISGNSVFGVSCGHVQESECDYTLNGKAYGLDEKGCCSPRPVMVSSSAKPTGTGICRNTLISVSFAEDMDVGSVTGNFEIAKELVNETNCPDGTKKLVLETQPEGVWQWIAFQAKKFWAWLTGMPTYAVWCTQTVSGTMGPVGESKKDFSYRLNASLEPNTRYIVRFMGDPDAGGVNDQNQKQGIRTARGVVAKADLGDDPQNAAGWSYSWWFQTGPDICRINTINVVDTDLEHPAFFRKAQEEHLFLARAISLSNGKPQAVTPTQEYSWEWVPWVVNDPKIALHKDAIGNQTAVMSQSSIQAVGVNGSAMVFAAVTITEDKIDQQSSTKGLYIEGGVPITVFLCDHPWPNLDANGSIVPLRDDRETVEKGLSMGWLKSVGFDSAADKKGFLDTLPYFNFQSMYCRDKGQAVLPVLTANLVPNNAVDDALGVLRQYILIFEDPAFKNDGIGIRVYQNLYHYTPLEWYKAQGFTGNPQSVKIDGFDAVKDTDTVYIGFPNTKGLNENLYQNILVISRNPGSSVVTQEVFDQLVQNFVFNTNFSFDNTNVCVQGGKTGQAGAAPYVDAAAGVSEPITCVSDYDCLKYKPSLRCASFKYKLRHDLQRLGDFKLLGTALETYRSQKGSYPKLSQGTFQSARSNSLWPSWLETVATEIGMGKPPLDPVNKFISCGVCQPPDGSTESAHIPCNTSKDCPDKKYTCVGTDGYDPATCWNTDARQFKCPYMDENGQLPKQSYDPYGTEEPWAQSRFYSYRSLSGGSRYELAANFEFPPPQFNSITGETENWWYPAFPKELQQCYTSSTVSNGRLCNKDQDCKPCLNPNAPTCGSWYPAKSCKPVGYRWVFKNMCGNEVSGDSGVCGDGIIGGACLDGANKGLSCKQDTDCPGSTCGSTEICELGQTKLVSCDYKGSGDGVKLQTCDECKGWANDPNLSICRAKVECGNGRIDGLCSGGQQDGQACTSNDECKDANGPHTCDIKETCDDGNLNGTYGHCGKNCTGIEKFCGNGQLDPGEVCDNGESNGVWCEGNGGWCYTSTNNAMSYDQTCGSGCKGKAPFCGDGIVEGLPSEECDGEMQITTKAICKGGSNAGKPCATNDDCAPTSGGVCGDANDARYQSCENVTIQACATGAKVCLTQTEANDLANGTFFANPYIVNSYVPCETDATCASKKSNSTCVSLNNAQKCQNDSQCSTPAPEAGKQAMVGSCRAYATQHSRSCNAPGEAYQCSYTDENTQQPKAWSACQIAHRCGDGVLDGGEECDNGKDNAYWNACLPTCKKATCGDSFTLLNVEECDSGSANGITNKALCNGDTNCEALVCDPKYGTTCNNCSQQCKFLAKAGGYCGNDIKETGEQCDGNVSVTSQSFTAFDKNTYILGADLVLADANAQAAKPYAGQMCDNPPCQIMCDSGVSSKQKCDSLADTSSLTCQQMGYDFALNGQLNMAIHIKPNSDTAIDTFSKQALSGCNKSFLYYKLLEGVNFANTKLKLTNALFVKCGLMEVKEVTDASFGSVCMPQWIPQEQWPNLRTFRQCVQLAGTQTGAFELVGTDNAKPSCSNVCKPTGCGRCSDESGEGKISGHILDRIWLQAVPGARVTLQFRGQNVDQVMTDDNGYYEFNNLNTRAECARYRLVIDKYDDNFCTSSNRPSGSCLQDITPAFNQDVDEGARGGYWPFTTDEFSIDSFPWQEMMGMIYIYPRPAKGEGYVSYGRPTLIDGENWQKMQDCKEKPTSAECQGFNPFAAWLPWKPQWTPHVIWPSNFSRLYPVLGNGLPGWLGNSDYPDVFNQSCNYAERGTKAAVADSKYEEFVCNRDYNHVNHGWGDLGTSPHTAVFCPRLKWEFTAQGCPMQGTQNCFDSCIESKGAMGVFKQWINFNVNDAFCNKFCKVGQPGCWTGVNGNGDDYTNGYDWCHQSVSAGQVTTVFRYADPSDMNKPLKGLVDPIEIYFSGQEYEPVKGEYLWTAGITDQAFSDWISNKAFPPAYVTLLKTVQCDNDPQVIDKAACKAKIDQGLASMIAKGNIAPLSWREMWARTKTKVYVSTDKGIYVLENKSTAQTRKDFQRPFWHIASIGNNGTVTVKNQWQSVGELGLPVENGQAYQPESKDPIRFSRAIQRPPGMSCWNTFGGSCEYNPNGTPSSNTCINTVGKGILSFYGANADTQLLTQVWNFYLTKNANPDPSVAECKVHSDDQSKVNFNQINW